MLTPVHKRPRRWSTIAIGFWSLSPSPSTPRQRPHTFHCIHCNRARTHIHTSFMETSIEAGILLCHGISLWESLLLPTTLWLQTADFQLLRGGSHQYFPSGDYTSDHCVSIGNTCLPLLTTLWCLSRQWYLPCQRCGTHHSFLRSLSFQISVDAIKVAKMADNR